jgi:hypothetical protein
MSYIIRLSYFSLFFIILKERNHSIASKYNILHDGSLILLSFSHFLNCFRGVLLGSAPTLLFPLSLKDFTCFCCGRLCYFLARRESG